jgi:hypothetical protein
VRPGFFLLPAIVLASLPARAAPILTPDAALLAKAATYQRQEQIFVTRESGIFLDVVIKPEDVDLVKAFFAQSAQPDFQTQTGKHPYDVVAAYAEYGDEGNFAGIASVGIAARLIVLRATGAPDADVAFARDAAIRALKTWHVYGAIGGPGVVARGVRKMTPNPGEPPLPGGPQDTTPLKDPSGAPLPPDQNGVWRAPVAPGFDGWLWMDDSSKDQVSGYTLGAAWLYDALKDDPNAPKDVLDQVGADLTAFAKALMQTAPELGIDLCIRDADGRLTGAHDLNPRQAVPEAVIPEDITLRNGFNAAMALGVIRAAYHVGGDPDVGRYYYEELVGKRNYPKLMADNAGIIFLGAPTNYSNVNMLAISLALIGRFETDPYVRGKLQETLAKQFWSTGDSRDVSHSKQAWFDAVYGAYAASPETVSARIAESLSGFQDAPAFTRDRTNCDDKEIAAGKCVAVDGTTVIVLDTGKGHGGGPVAKDIVPWSVRPDSDFEWRDDPHEVNGQASSMMNPGGDFLAAYWLARASDTDTSKNVSPAARPALPYTLAPDDNGDDAGAGPAPGPSSSGGCASAGARESGWLAALFAVFALAAGALARRRRSA